MIKKLSKDIIIQNELGLHARPAAMIAKLALGAKSKVWIIKDDEKVDASSIIDILTLACLKGTSVTLQIEDHTDIGVLDTISDLIENNFEE